MDRNVVVGKIEQLTSNNEGNKSKLNDGLWAELIKLKRQFQRREIPSSDMSSLNRTSCVAYNEAVNDLIGILDRKIRELEKGA